MSDERSDTAEAPSAGTPSAGAPSDQGRRRPQRPLWQAVVINVLAMLVAVSLIQAFLVRVHNVSSGSMEQTLGVTDRVLSSRLPYLASSPARGDIVIFAHGDSWDTSVRTPSTNPLKQLVRYFGDVTSIGTSNHLFTVKRVIGVAGDTVACCDTDGHVLVNGTSTSEPYLYQDLPFASGTLDCASDPRSSRCFAPIVVPAGKLLVMGDHRSNSADSVASCRRAEAASDCAKFVDVAQVTGKVIARAWPPGPIG